MRTNIDINDDLLDLAMKAGPFTSKKDAVEAGLKLLARQVAYQEILALRGKLHWQDEQDEVVVSSSAVHEPAKDYLAVSKPNTKARK